MIPSDSGGSAPRQRKPNRQKARASRSKARPTGPKPSSGNGTPQSARGAEGSNEFWWIKGGNPSVSQGYGVANSMYEHGFHDGMDIAVPVGTPLAALTSGTVIFAGDAGADGMRVGIQMDNGRVYYYGHMSRLDVEVGDRVGRGQVVGKSGDTGRTTGPHVHFELDRNEDGTGDSPYQFMRRWTGGRFNDSSAGTGGGSGPDTAKYPTGKSGSGMADDNTTADYGWAEAVFNSNPELKELLKKAKANDWDQATMQAAIRGTDWYRTHSETWRKNWVLKRDQPESYQRNLDQAQTTVDAIANEFGVTLTQQQRNKIAHDYLWLGLDQNELNQAVGSYFNGQGDYRGSAGDLQDKITSMAADYGVNVSDDWISKFVKRVLTGQATEQDAQNHIVEMAKAAYPGLSQQIDGGMTVRALAEPYMQSMSRLLETPLERINVRDPMIRRALQSVGPDGNPVVTPEWKFEEQVRKDPRWLTTNNARDSMLSKANDILSTWGLM